MNAYKKTTKEGLNPLPQLQQRKHRKFSHALHYALLGLAAASHANAQLAAVEPAQPEKPGKAVATARADAQPETTLATAGRAGTQLAAVEPAGSEKPGKRIPSAEGDAQQEDVPAPAKPETAPVLPTVVIKDTAVTAPYVAKNTTTATKTDTPIIEIPQSISVITRRELDARGVQFFTEALRYVPGVVVDTFGFNGQGFEYLGMRGFNVQTTANFRDNLNQAATGVFFGAFITDPYALERIDVLRGPSSVMFGRGDAGGIVNRVTKLPTAAPIREVELQYGSFGRKRVAADFGLANDSGTLMFRLVTSALDTDTQVLFPNTNGDRAGIKRFYIAPSLTWRPSEKTSITLFGDILNNRAGAGAFYPAAPTGDADGSFSNTPTNAVQGDPGFSRYSTNQASLSYKLEHHFNQTWTIRQNFRYQSQSGNFRDLTSIGYLPDDLSGILSRSALSTTEKIDQTVLDTHLQGKLSTGPVNHTVLVGIDWNRMNSTALKFVGDAPSLNVFNPVYFQPVPTPTSLDTDAKQRLDQVGFYVQDQVKYQKWILTLSGRHDRISNNTIATITALDSSPIPFQTRDSAYTGRAGLTYLFSNGISPYASYSQSFLPQAGLADGAPFNPTRASQYEVGIKYQPVGTRNLFTVALFDLTKTNVLTPNPNVSSFANQFIQVGEIRSRGAELEARAEIYRGLNFIGAFTYNDVKVRDGADGTVGKMPIRIPNTTTSGWLDYNLGALNIGWLRGFGIGGGVRYVGRVFNDEENTSTTRSFTLFDAMLRYDQGPWRFSIVANNLFNEKYYSATSGGNFFRGTDRTVYGTLKLQF